MLMPASPPQPSLSPVLKLLLHRSQTSQQGLTIMECLVAIMLIGITIAMVTPPLLIATASRVQTRRGEQALQVAQDEVDRINTMVQRGLHQSSLLPPNATQANLRNVPPPTSVGGAIKTTRRAGCGTAYSEQTPLPINQALQIDVDGDCKPDFYMQVIRTGSQFTLAETVGSSSTKTAQTVRPAKFDLGVRVYSALAQRNLVSGQLSNPPTPASFGLTIGQGQQATNPLAVVYKTLSWGERSEVLCQYATKANRDNLSGCN
jgi:type II secretory pathway pseudopilin PulG